jgi:hypothetical protein
MFPQAEVQLVVNFSLFELFARLIFLSHCATSVLSSVTAPQRYDLTTRGANGISSRPLSGGPLPGHKHRVFVATRGVPLGFGEPVPALRAAGERVERLWTPISGAGQCPIWRRGECCGKDGRQCA